MENTLIQYLIFVFIGFCGIFVGRKMATRKALNKFKNKNVDQS